MHQDDATRLRDMLRHAQEAIDLVGDTPVVEFASNRVLSLAVTRLVEIIGEAAAHVSAETQSALNLPWREVIATRNRYIHAYGDIDSRVVWAIVTRDLPPVVQLLHDVLS